MHKFSACIARHTHTGSHRKTTPASAESGTAQEIVKKHARWLTIAMGSYDAARHRGIAELYVCDERFGAYYDRETEGCAQFLRDAVAFWAGK